MRNVVVLVSLGALLAALAISVRSGFFARRDPGQPINRAMREALGKGGNQLSAEDAETIAKNYPDAQKTASGLLYIVRTEGDGPTPQVGAMVTAHYEGRLIDGTKFDSSRDRGDPITFKVGVGNVVPGWDEALLTMKRGEKRTLILPFWLGYGEKGRRPIPPRATLVFEVELLDFTR